MTSRRCSTPLRGPVVAHEKLANAVKKDPGIVKKYRNERPPISAGEGVTADEEEAVTEVTITLSVRAKDACQ